MPRSTENDSDWSFWGGRCEILDLSPSAPDALWRSTSACLPSNLSPKPDWFYSVFFLLSIALSFSAGLIMAPCFSLLFTSFSGPYGLHFCSVSWPLTSPSWKPPVFFLWVAHAAIWWPPRYTNNSACPPKALVSQPVKDCSKMFLHSSAA